MTARRSRAELEKLRRAGLILYEVLQEVVAAVQPGATTWDLEEAADRAIRQRDATSAFRGYHGYPCVLCVSVDDQVIHGIPSRKRTLAAGEIVSLDCGVVVDGYYSDSARTVAVGGLEQASEPARELLRVTEAALEQGIGQARAGQRIGDISHTVQLCAEGAGFSVVREFVGHGIGTHLHEDPQVPNYGPAGGGQKLKPGMVLAIEPMVNRGTAQVEVQPDGWTAVTADHSLSAHFEHTVAITDEGPWVLTRP